MSSSLSAADILRIEIVKDFAEVSTADLAFLSVSWFPTWVTVSPIFGNGVAWPIKISIVSAVTSLKRTSTCIFRDFGYY